MTGPSGDRNCRDWWPLIDELVDGTLAASAREHLDRHLAACPDCAQLASDLSQIRRVAGALPPRSPRSDAWQRIAAEIARNAPDPRVSRSSSWRPTSATFRPSPWAALAAAAVLVLAVASTVWLVRQPGNAFPSQQTAAPAPGSPAGSPVHQTPEDLVKTVDDELRAAEMHYERAIAGLEQIARSGQDVLDPQLAATLQANLGVIDKAIKDSRAAIQAQPGSPLAQDSLFEALRRKVALLEDTVALINAMRKGDQEGTARVIQGMSKS